MNILLIEPGVMEIERFVYEHYPPLGLMYLASYLRKKRSGHTISLIDMLAEKAKPEAIEGVLRSTSPDLVAIHTMTFQASFMQAIAARIKSWNPQCVVSVGGPHPSAFLESTFVDSNIDIIGVYEGEQTFVDIVDRIDKGEDLAGIPGTIVKRDGEFIRGPDRSFINDLDLLPLPARDLVNLDKYFADVMNNANNISYRNEVTPIFTSRGCPFGCIFCHNMFGKKFRARTAENVLDEMEMLQREYGIRELHIIDDCFNFNTERALEIMVGIRKRGLDFKLAFPNGIRGDRLPEELLHAMVEAGVYRVAIGIESGSPRIQKKIRKGISLKAVRDGISRVAAHGIFAHGFFMLGFPDETKEDIKATIDFACKSDLHTAGFSILSSFPGTEVHQIATEKGQIIEINSDNVTYQKVTANVSAVDSKTLVRMHKFASWKFYLNPIRIYRMIKAMPHPIDFFRSLRAHFRLKFIGI